MSGRVSIEEQSDGKILTSFIAGTSITVIRYNADGSVDTTFASSGVYSSGGLSYTSLKMTTHNSAIYIFTTDLTFSPGFNYNNKITKLNMSSGALDTSFGTNGVKSITLPNNSIGNVDINSSGEIFISGSISITGNGTDYYLSKYTSSGDIDTSFGTNGTATVDFENLNNFAWGMDIQSDGKILVAGNRYQADGNHDFAIARFNTDGTLDNTFNGQYYYGEDSTSIPVAFISEISDVDNTSQTITITTANGTSTLSTVSGLSFTTGDGTDDTTMVFSGTINDINTALQTLKFTPTADFDGTATITVNTNDGNTSAQKVMSITINNAPEITSITRESVPPGESNAITNADSLVFYVYLSDDIPSANAATTADFEVIGSTTATVTSVVRQSIYYEVTVSGGDLASFNGTVGLKFKDDNTVKNSSGVPIGGEGIDHFTTGEIYTLDNTAPTANLSSVTDDEGSITGTLTSGDRTDDTSLVLSGTNESESTVKVYNGTTFVGNATVTGTTWTYTIPIVNGTTYQLNVKETDTSGNESSATSNFTVIGDTSAPTANLTSVTDNVGSVTGALTSTDVTDDTSLVLSGTNESGSSVEVFNGTTKLGNATVTGTSWTYTATVVNGTTYQLNVKETDSAGNTSAVTSNFEVTADTTKPTVVITSDKDSLKAGETATITFSLNESSSDFTSTDVTVSGGSLSNFTGSGTSYTTTLTPDTNSTSNITLDIAANKFEDVAGNNNTAATQKVITVDTLVPTVNIGANKTNVINGDTVELTITLSEDSGNFVDTDITVTGGTLSNFAQDGSNSKVYTVTFTVDDTTTTNVTAKINATSFTDSAGNDNSVSNTLTLPVFPSIKTLTPNLDATGVAIDSNLVIEFSETVSKGTGDIVVKKVSDDSTIETIDVTSSSVVITNNTTVTITRSNEFELNTPYYVQIATTAFKDVDNQNYAGITDNTTWKFTSVDNAAPVITNDSSNATSTISVDENQTAVVDIDATDVNTNQTLTYTISGTDASSFDIDSTTGVITFKTAPDYETKSSYEITATVTDNGGGTLSDSQTLTININDVNETPSSANNSFTILEDNSKTFAASDFAFTDVDTGNSLQAVVITSLPTNGTLSLDGTPVVLEGTPPHKVVTLPNISKLVYTPEANANGTAYATFNFRVDDGQSSSSTSGDYTTTINVTAVDDAPTITTTLSNQTQDEDGRGLVIALNTTDIDSDLNTTPATYSATSSDTSVATVQVVGGVLVVVPVKNASGTVTITLDVTVNGKTTQKTFDFTVNEVNDAPTIENIGDISHEQSPNVITKTITFDIWDDIEVTSLTATSSNTSLIVNNDINVVKNQAGTQADITYTIAANNAGLTKITIVAEDAASETYSESFSVRVNAADAAQCVENTKTKLVFDDIKSGNTYQNTVTGDLNLITTLASICDGNITWDSSDKTVVSNSGTVTQGSDDKTINLIATITKTDASTNETFTSTKPFLITVLKSAGSLSDQEVLDKLLFETIKEDNISKYQVVSNLNLLTSYLGKTITWTSNNDSVISPYSGYVTRSTTGDETVTLTATIGSTTKTFDLTVLKEETNDADIIAKDKELLTFADILGDNRDKNNIIYNLEKPLPSTGPNGSTITWSSSNTNIITNDGDVFRDENADKYVTLTATITSNGETTTKEFDFKVLQNKITNSSTTFQNAGETNTGTQVTTDQGQTQSSFASTILSAVETVVSQQSIQSIVEFVDKLVNVYLNTDGTTNSTLQTNSGTASLNNESTGASTSVEDDGDITSTSNTSNGSVRLKLNKDGSVSHEVTNTSEGKTSTASSTVANSEVRSDENGTVETTSEVKDGGFLYKAVVTTTSNGETATKFVKVDLSTGDESEFDKTVSDTTPFQSGNEVEISQIDGSLYIKTTTPLDGSLVIE